MHVICGRTKRMDLLLRVTLALVVIAILSACTSSAPAPAPSAPTVVQAPPSQAPSQAAVPKPTNTVEPKKPDKVKIGYGSLSVTYYWLQLAKDEGIFEKNGLDAEPIFMGQGTTGVQSLIAGEIDFTVSGSSETASANAAGADLRIIASASPQMNFMVVATDKIKTPGDLKGGKIAISRPGTSSDTAVKTFLKKVGLEYQKDVTIVAVGDDRTRLGAMAGGTVDATVITSPGLQAKPFGFHVLADLADYGVLAEPGPLDTTVKMIREKPDVVRRVVKSYIDAIYLGKKDRPAAIKAMKTFYKTEDQETAEANVDWSIKHFEPVPYVREEGVQFAIDEASQINPNLKGAKPADVIDNSFVAEFDKSGYIKKLYGN